MNKRHSSYSKTSIGKAKQEEKSKEPSNKAKGDCNESRSSSHTQIFRRNIHKKYERITTDEYLGISKSVSGSSETSRCVHGPEVREHTEKTKLNRFFVKKLDPIPTGE